MPALAPFTSKTLEYGKLLKVDAAWKVNSIPFFFWASNVRVRYVLSRNAPEAVQYTPGKIVLAPVSNLMFESQLG